MVCTRACVCVCVHAQLALTGTISGSPEPGVQEAHALALADRVLWLSVRTVCPSITLLMVVPNTLV